MGLHTEGARLLAADDERRIASDRQSHAETLDELRLPTSGDVEKVPRRQAPSRRQEGIGAQRGATAVSGASIPTAAFTRRARFRDRSTDGATAESTSREEQRTRAEFVDAAPFQHATHRGVGQRHAHGASSRQ